MSSPLTDDEDSGYIRAMPDFEAQVDRELALQKFSNLDAFQRDLMRVVMVSARQGQYMADLIIRVNNRSVETKRTANIATAEITILKNRFDTPRRQAREWVKVIATAALASVGAWLAARAGFGNPP